MSAARHNPHTSSPESGVNRMNDKGELVDVGHLHAAIMREHSEPREGNEPLSLWYVAFICALFFWGGFYLQRFSGGYKPLVYDEHSSGEAPVLAASAQNVDLFTQGKRLFADTCGKCHQANGQGLPGQYPPLAGSEWVAAAGPARIIRIVLDGLQGPIQVKGVGFQNQMVPWREPFTDQQIAAVLTYVRGEKEWGNSFAEVKPEQVAAIREKTKARAEQGPWTADELLAVPEVEK